MAIVIYDVREGSVLIEGLEEHEFAAIEEARHEAARMMLSETVHRKSRPDIRRRRDIQDCASAAPNFYTE
ncbi:hypothetical protein Sa4125_21910 [Aureimonas sp. SA4125]|uniref:hypothetical protein n=1 Tax=Aureimonas sp. SA4125 TaxID=2826993 RepID=UPI001CC77DCF|nr:hypothetical protein [Aureimonas sp. SA4125]BDA84649.1 hypothetical protein Sa4125_21910 [Aureimonas sp. SA4125]